MLVLNNIVLRECRDADLAFLVRTRQDLDIEIAAQPGPPVSHSIDQFESRLRAGHLAVSSGAPDSIEFILSTVDTENAAPIGVGGLYGLDAHNRVAEFGVTISDRSHWGTGAGFDAHLALLQYGFEYRGLHRMYAHVKADNTGVLRLCQRLGMTQEGILRQHRWKRGKYVDLVVFGLLAEEWDPTLVDWREAR
jgi:RimJ/RimL family protein N-acetyltransferase